MSEDPIGMQAGDTNLGRYLKNSPTNGSDPTGLFDPLDWLGEQLADGAGPTDEQRHTERACYCLAAAS